MSEKLKAIIEQNAADKKEIQHHRKTLVKHVAITGLVTGLYLRHLYKKAK